MFQLAKANDPEAIELITQLLANESDFKVIASGLSALAQMKAQAALAAIQNFLSHEDSRVRANAVSSIDLILGDDNPKPMLERMLKDRIIELEQMPSVLYYYQNPRNAFSLFTLWPTLHPKMKMLQP